MLIGVTDAFGTFFGQFFRPSVTTPDLVANTYESLQYGRLPNYPRTNPAPAPVVPLNWATDPNNLSLSNEENAAEWRAWAERNRNIIAQSENNGTYTPSGTLPSIDFTGTVGALQDQAKLLLWGAAGFLVLMAYTNRRT